VDSLKALSENTVVCAVASTRTRCVFTLVPALIKINTNHYLIPKSSERNTYK